MVLPSTRRAIDVVMRAWAGTSRVVGTHGKAPVQLSECGGEVEQARRNRRDGVVIQVPGAGAAGWQMGPWWACMEWRRTAWQWMS